MNTDAMEARQVCTFFLDGLLFGVDVTTVQEVMRHLDMTPVPRAPPVVSGLINLRGQIVTALDLRQRLGLPARPAHQQPMNVVIRQQDGAVSFLVDEIGDVVDVDSASFEAPPDTLDSATKALIHGVYKLETQLLLFLDAHLASRVDGSNLINGSHHGNG